MPKIEQLRTISIWLALLVGLYILIYQFRQLSGAIFSVEDDFLEYWTAGRLILSGNNPYSPELMLSMQKEVGWPHPYPVVMYNPPWTLVVIFWSSFFSYPTARVLWLLVMVGAILLSADLAWRHYGGSAQYRWLAGCLALLFIPALKSLNLGQINPLVLLGLVGFLYFNRRMQWKAAGACLVLAAIKPQLIYLLWPALALWVFVYRKWSLVIGGAVVTMGGLAIPMLLYPELLRGYIEMTLYYPAAVWWGTPTWGALLRVWFGSHLVWLQWIPAIFGFVWLAVYWRQNYVTWEWSRSLPHILLVSFLTGIYGWVHDQTILILAIIQAAILLLNKPNPGVVAFYVVFNGLLFAVMVAGTGSISEVWTILVWPLLYAWVYLPTNGHATEPTVMPRLMTEDSSEAT
jgi:hypothetical protein